MRKAHPFGRLPEGWERHLPQAAPLGAPERWRQALASSDAGADITDVLLPAIDLLAGGTDCAQQAGETFLRGAARLLWRRALSRAPASALEGIARRHAPAGRRGTGNVARLDACLRAGDLSARACLAAGPECPHLAARQPGRPVAARSRHPVIGTRPAARHADGPAGLSRDLRHDGAATGLLRQPPRCHRAAARSVAAAAAGRARKAAARAGAIARDERTGSHDGPPRRVRHDAARALRHELLAGLEQPRHHGA